MIFPSSKDALIDALSGRAPLKKILKVAELTVDHHKSLNVIRLDKGWDKRESNIITMSQNDVRHMHKRITQDGLTPEEVVAIAEHALSEDSTVGVGRYSRAMLEHPTKMDIDGNRFRAQIILMDGMDWSSYRMFGVIPKGWSGR
jgi:hypothetical protein